MYRDKKVYAIVPAAGSGKRMGQGINKQLLELQNKPVIVHTLEKFEHNAYVDFIILVVKAEEKDYFKREIKDKYQFAKILKIIEGGSERQESVYKGLKAIEDLESLVLIHDGARPFVTEQILVENIKEAYAYGRAVTAVKVKDTVKIVKEGKALETPPRQWLYLAQTPQSFEYPIIMEAHKQADRDGYIGTDDSSLVERLGLDVKIVEGDYHNIKITTPEDLIVALQIVKEGEKMKIRVGIGYDVHQLVVDRSLIIGGVNIPYEKGLLGHSDADVLLHAITDALLGAMGKGDIGKHFPDTSAEFKDIDSRVLLRRVASTMKSEGYTIGNIDGVIIAQKPKMAPYIEQMKANIAEDLACDLELINIKATTTETLGFEGRGEGISSQAVVMIEKE